MDDTVILQEATPRVFMSYSWDNREHKAWVRRLAEALRKQGVNVHLDQWYVQPGDSITSFMESEVMAADFVIVVGTPAYAMKSDLRQGGVGYEQQIVSGRLFSGVPRRRFIPIVRSGNFDEGEGCALPAPFLSTAATDFRADERFRRALEELLRAIFSSPRFKPPSVGEKPTFARHQQKSSYISKSRSRMPLLALALLSLLAT